MILPFDQALQISAFLGTPIQDPVCQVTCLSVFLSLQVLFSCTAIIQVLFPPTESAHSVRPSDIATQLGLSLGLCYVDHLCPQHYATWLQVCNHGRSIGSGETVPALYL